MGPLKGHGEEERRVPSTGKRKTALRAGEGAQAAALVASCPWAS